MLDRLGTGYIDLLLLHQQFGDYLGAWKDMERAVADGRVRSIGISNFESDHLEEPCEAADIKPAVNQVECHPYYRQAELKRRMAPYGTAVECWYPLGHGDSGLLAEPLLEELGGKYGKLAKSAMHAESATARYSMFLSVGEGLAVAGTLRVFPLSGS